MSSQSHGRFLRPISFLTLVLLALILSSFAVRQVESARPLLPHHVQNMKTRRRRELLRAEKDPEEDDDDDDDQKVGINHQDVDEDTNLDISDADKKALGLSPNRRHGADSFSGGDQEDLAGSLQSLGLSAKDMEGLRQLEREGLPKQHGLYSGKKDKRAMDAPPPPGMVASGKGRHSVHNVDRPPPKPHQPRVGEGVEVDAVVRAAKDTQKSAGKLAAAEANIKLLRKITDLTSALSQVKTESEQSKVELSNSKNIFSKSIEEAKLRHRVEKEELTATIEERKRAFDELYEEKQVLGQILSEEQKTLHELQEKIQHPDLGLWIRQRAERAAILVETPETDAMKFYAHKYMAPKVTKMRHRLEVLERRVEKSVDHLLPAKYGSVVALLLCIGLIGFPLFVTFSTVWSVTKSVSLRQYVLLGNVFLTAFSSGLCIAGIILQQDPLQTLYEASESMFVMMQLAAAVTFPIFVGVIFCAVLKSRDQEDGFVFGCELVFYILVGLNYRTRVWRPAMLGETIETSRMMYVVYVIDFLSMTALTISSAKMERSRLPTVADEGESGKVGPTLAERSGLAALGSGLVKAARGSSNSGTVGKEE